MKERKRGKEKDVRNSFRTPPFGGLYELRRRVQTMWDRVLFTLVMIVSGPCVAVALGDEPEPAFITGKMVSKDGKAELTFGKWQLVFEGVPCDSAGARVVFQYPSKSGPGKSGPSSFDGVKISQKWDTEVNEISVENFSFKLLGKAEKLAFKDRTYPATDKTQRIIIDQDGKTKLADKK
jgi:hypothetical protein